MRTRTRTVELHERIECPPLRIFVLSMLIGPAERPWFEVSSVRELWVIHNLWSPLIKEANQEESLIGEKGLEYEPHPRYSHIPIPRNRERVATSLVRMMTRH